jgi:hypothetical protein
MATPKKTADRHAKEQLNVRVSAEAHAALAALRSHYATRAGLPGPLSQATALEMILRDAVRRAGLKLKGG